MSTEVTVTRLPSCDFCADAGVPSKAEYDFRTVLGSWANGCRRHYLTYRAHNKLGTGHGQRLILRSES